MAATSCSLSSATLGGVSLQDSEWGSRCLISHWHLCLCSGLVLQSLGWMTTRLVAVQGAVQQLHSKHCQPQTEQHSWGEAPGPPLPLWAALPLNSMYSQGGSKFYKGKKHETMHILKMQHWLSAQNLSLSKPPALYCNYWGPGFWWNI